MDLECRQCASAVTPIWSICGHSQVVAHLGCHSLVAQRMPQASWKWGWWSLVSHVFYAWRGGTAPFCDMLHDVLIRWVLDTGLGKLGSLGSFQKVEILTTTLKNALRQSSHKGTIEWVWICSAPCYKTSSCQVVKRELTFFSPQQSRSVYRSTGGGTPATS